MIGCPVGFGLYGLGAFGFGWSFAQLGEARCGEGFEALDLGAESVGLGVSLAPFGPNVPMGVDHADGGVELGA
jgi:hypothetical protein